MVEAVETKEGKEPRCLIPRPITFMHWRGFFEQISDAWFRVYCHSGRSVCGQAAAQGGLRPFFSPSNPQIEMSKWGGVSKMNGFLHETKEGEEPRCLIPRLITFMHWVCVWINYISGN